MKFVEHPLWPTIRALNKAEGIGPLEYSPLPGFMGNNSEQHTFAAQQESYVALHAICLQLAMEGERDFDAEKHHDLLKFVSSTTKGILIGAAAEYAKQTLRFFPAFSESLRLPGFMEAVEAQLNAKQIRRKLNADGEWMESLARAYDEAEEEPERYDWYFRQALGAAPDSLTFSRELHAIIQRKAYAKAKDKNREEKAQKKGKARTKMKNRFLDMLLAHWIDAALWCRSSYGILQILEPGSESLKDVEALENDIAKLKLTRSRMIDHEAIIVATW
jgi:hypothetical protein